MTGESADRQAVKTYLDAAHEALAGSQYNLDGGYYAIAVNRAYYAVLYAANALLATKGLARGKHSGTISAFRQSFVKPGTYQTRIQRHLRELDGRPPCQRLRHGRQD